MKEALFLRACRGEMDERPPVWLMRQAGRYLPSYQTLRKRYSFEELCFSAQLAAKISLLPYETLGVDAVIIFSDLLTPLSHCGFEVIYGEGGPTFSSPFVKDDLKKLRARNFNDNLPTARAIAMLRNALPANIPIIGFAGAPFTLACYLVEGRGSSSFSTFKTLFYRERNTTLTLLEELSQVSVDFLCLQVRAGAEVVQIFDTWAGILSISDFNVYRPILQKCIGRFKKRHPDIPCIYYVNGAVHLLPAIAELGMDILSVDWRVSLANIRRQFPSLGLQGNLDPTVLLGSEEKIITETKAMLQAMSQAQKYICNLGSGVLPQTPVESVKLFVQTAKLWKSQ